jgi:hypothetical protein
MEFASKGKATMKLQTTKYAIRIVILAAGLVVTYFASSVGPLPAADGGPILVCQPNGGNCKTNLPSIVH